VQHRLRAALAVLALGLTFAPTAFADEDPDSSDTATAVGITGVSIDPEAPNRVRVDIAYTCAASDGPRSLNTSVELPAPDAPATVAFGSTRSFPAQLECDGDEHHRTVSVQSKTNDWLTGVDAVVITTLADLGAAPPAFADAQQVVLELPPDC